MKRTRPEWGCVELSTPSLHKMSILFFIVSLNETIIGMKSFIVSTTCYPNGFIRVPTIIPVGKQYFNFTSPLLAAFQHTRQCTWMCLFLFTVLAIDDIQACLYSWTIVGIVASLTFSTRVGFTKYFEYFMRGQCVQIRYLTHWRNFAKTTTILPVHRSISIACPLVDLVAWTYEANHFQKNQIALHYFILDFFTCFEHLQSLSGVRKFWLNISTHTLQRTSKPTGNFPRNIIAYLSQM